MTIALNILIAAAVIGGFAVICSLVQKYRLQHLFVSATSGIFVASVIWAIAKFVPTV